MVPIYHITQRDQWQLAQTEGSYTAESLQSQGFIHCSTVSQILRVADNFYRGQRNLVLLCIDPEKVIAEVKFEPPINPVTHQPEPHLTELFPHIYGTLNIDAVFQVLPLLPNEDGNFTLPAGVSDAS